MNEEYIQNVNSPFFMDLKKDVEDYFVSRRITMYGNNAMKIKTFSLVLLYLVSYSLLYIVSASTTEILLVYTLMGFTSSLVLVNISHDAAHGTIFETPVLNRIMSYTFNLMGSNEYFWRLTHNDVHHPYPNVPGIDPDIDQGPLIRLSPAVPRYKFHRYQHLYAPLLYSLFSLYLVFIKDFRLLFMKDKTGHRVYPNHPIKEIVILFVSKILFLGYIIVLPVFVLPVSWMIIVAGFFIYSFVQSNVITVLTAPVHVTEEASFDHYDNEKNVAMDWVARQVETTTDFSIKNRVIDFFLGGANYQVMHHLFPKIAHIHLRGLNTILQKNTAKHNIHYMRVSLWKAYLSHLKRLKYFGTHQE
jgi:linoleoyl-CoA desaturase